MNWTFDVGLFSFLFALALPLVYLTAYGFRAIGAWLIGNPGPTDRVWPIVMMAAVAGFLMGSFFQPQWDGLSECHRQERGLVTCMLALPQAR